MKQLLFIDACIRKTDSRTRTLSLPIIKALKNKYSIITVKLNDKNIVPVTSVLYEHRKKNGPSLQDKHYAKLFASVDRIVVAAPFWDMSFPSILKVFFEHISIPGYTFLNLPDGNTKGNCKSDKLLYITTRGMDIATGEARDIGTAYLNALGWLWGIPKIITVAASGMDVIEENIRNKRLTDAINEGLLICKNF